VSVAAHEQGEVDRARARGASAVLVSPVFASPGKGEPRGTAFLSEARSRAGTLRVYALGGVDESNAASCRRAGADGVAIVRAIWGAGDVRAIVRAIREAVKLPIA
jgi:thiamine-phosphate pyrophosphorylase